jgi:5-methylcytosine-specific restriction enzyme subunit McrC
LPVFEFPKVEGLRLWVLPFCLKSRRLSVPHGAQFIKAFPDRTPVHTADAEVSAVD